MAIYKTQVLITISSYSGKIITCFTRIMDLPFNSCFVNDGAKIGLNVGGLKNSLLFLEVKNRKRTGWAEHIAYLYTLDIELSISEENEEILNRFRNNAEYGEIN